jgi:putative tricarboxylic transport membrane protein
MYVGNALLLLMNIFLIPLFVAMLRIPYSIIMGFIVIFASIGAYSVNNNMFDVSMMVGFGLLVYAMRSCTIPSSRSSWQWSSGGSPKTPSVRRSRSPPGD